MNKKYRTVYNKASKTWTLSLVNEEKQVSSRMNGKRFVFNAIASGLMIASGQAFAANGAVTTDDVSTRAAGTDNVCYFDSKTNAVICGSNASASSTGSVAIGTDAKAGGRTKPNTQTVDTADVNNIAIGQGAVASAQNPIEAIGSGNIAIGKNVKAVGNSSLAMGNSTGNYGGPQTYAAGADSYAIGNGARTGTTVNSASQVTGKQSTIEATPALGAIAFGSDSWVKDEGRYGIAIGDNAYVGLDNGVNKANNDDVNGGVAIGRRARVTKKYATAMGSYAQATGAQSIAIGGSSSETYAAKASGLSSIALGEVTRSEGLRSVAISKEANATATDSIAMGTKSKATGVNAVAVGSDALSTAESGIAIGKGANIQPTVLIQATNALNKAQKDYDNAVKAGGSSPNDEQKTAIATAKTALDTAKTNYTTAATAAAGLTKNSIAIGKGAQVEGMQSISIGTGNKVTGNNAGAYGDPSEVRGNNSYTFGNDNIVNTETSGAFILGNQNGMGTLGKYDANGKLILGSVTDTTNASNSVSLGNRNHITTEDTFVLGSGINTKGTGSSLTSIGSTVANSVYLGKDSSANDNKKADETKYQTSLDSNEAGKTTTGGMAIVDKATVNGISYSGFAGNTPIGVVTVGYSGGERRIQNVAAGEIAATSTDAINGSQLYLITEGLSKQISGNTTALGGNAAYNPETKVYTAPTYNLYTGTSTPNTTGSNTQPASTSHTVGDAITALNNYVNNGFNVKDNGGNTQGVVTPGESVQFINGTGTTSTVTTEDNGVTKIQYDVVKSGLTANPSNGTVTATDKGDVFATAGDIATAINNSGFIATASGNETGAKEQLIKAGEKVTLDAGKNLTVAQEGGKFSFATADDVNFNNVNTHTLSVGNSQTTPVVNMTTTKAVPASNNATAPATALDIKSDGKPTQITGVGSTLNKEDVATNPMTNGASNPVNTQLVNLTENSVNPNSAATVGDLQNMGWLVSATEGNGYKDVVKNANQVNFKGTGLATVKGETVGNIRTITVDVNAQAVSNKSQLPVVYTKADGTKVVKDPVSGNFYVANADGTPDTKQQVAVGDVITSMNNGDNSTTAPTTLANVKGSLKPTYNVGDMTIGQDGKPTQVAATAPTKSETLAPADAAKVYNHAATVGDVLNAGWNLQNNGDAKDFVKPYDTVNFVNGTGTTAVVTTSADGKTSEIRIDSPMGYVGTDGKTVDANGKPNTATNSVSLVGKDDAKPVALKNVSSGLVDNSTGDAVKLADAAGTTLTNAVNVGDLKQAAAAATTKVDGDSGVSVTPKTNADGSITYTVAAKTDGVTTEVVNGNIVAKTSSLTINDETGKVNTPNSPTSLATAGDIAAAINNSGFIATASGNQTGAKEQLIKAGEKVTLDAGKNLTVVQEDGKFSFATADDVNFNNVNTHTLSVGNSQTTPVVNMTTAVAVPATNNATEPATALDIKSSDGKPTQITGVGSTLNKEDVATNPMTNGASNPVNTQLVNLTENSVNPNSAATVGDLQNMGWLVSATEGNGYKDVVKNANQVDFKGTGLATVKGETVGNIRTITVDVNAQAVSNKSQLPVVYTKADGTKVVKDPVSGNFYVANADGTPDTKQQVAVGDVITSMNNGDNSTTAPTTLANVKGSLKPTYNVGDMTIGQDGKPTQVAATAPTKSETLAPADAAKVYNHAATVGDVLNAGWNLQNNGDAKDFVKPYDTVNFVNGTGTTAVVTTSADGKTSEIRIDSPMGYVGTDGKTVDANGKPNTATNSVSLVGKDDTKPVALKNVSSGLVDNSTGDAVKLADAAGTTLTNAVNVGDLKQAAAAATTKVDGDSGVSVTPQTNADGSTTYTVAAKTDGVTTEVVEGKIVAKTSPLTNDTMTGKVNTPNSPTSLATAGDIATAINNSGFIATASGNQTGAKEQLIKAGEKVTLDAGKNLTVVQEDGKFSFATADDVNFNNVNTHTLSVGNSQTTPVVNMTTAVAVPATNNATEPATALDIKSSDGKPTQITGVGSTLNKEDVATNPMTNGASNPVNTQLVNLTENSVNPNSAATVGDLQNMGWLVSATEGNGYKDVVKNANQVDFKGTGLATVKGETVGNIRTITVDVNAQAVSNKSQLPVVYTKADGTKVVKDPVSGNFYVANADGTPDTKQQVAVGDVITSMNNGDNSTTAPTTLANVKGSLKPTYNVGDMTIGQDGKPTQVAATAPTKSETLAPADAAKVYNHAATVGDVLNAGWNLQNNGDAKDFVKPYDTVNFVNGTGTTAVVTTSADGKTSEIRIDSPMGYVGTDGKTVDANGKPNTATNSVSLVGKDDTKPVALKNVSSGLVDNSTGDAVKLADAAGTTLTNAVNVGDLKQAAAAATTKVDGDSGVSVTPQTNADGSTTYTVAAKTDGVTTEVVEGKIVAKTSPLTNDTMTGKVNTPNSPTSLATAGDIATAINNSGFIATASGNQTGAKEQLIKAGEKVTLDAGKNLTVVQEDGKFSFATADDVNFNNVNTHTLSVGNSQTTPVVNMTTAVAVPATNNATEPATALDIKSSDGKPTQITGVGSTLNKEDVATNPMTNGASNPVNTQLVNLTENSVNPNSAATVGDLQNMGWLVSATEGNGYKDVVKNANQVDFKGTGLATVKGETVGNIRTITVDVNAQAVSNKSQLPVVYTKADGTKVVKDPVSGNFYVANADGTPDTKQQVAVGDVITSMNNGDNSTTAPTTLANVKGSLKPTYNVGDMTIGQDGKPTQVAATAPTKSETLAPADAAKVYNHAATVGDVLNAGWNLQNNGDAKDFVKPYDTVNFVNGTGTTAVVTTSADGKTSEIRIDSPMGYVGTDGKTVDANGKPNTATNSVSLVGKDDAKPVALKNVSSGLVDNSTGDAVKLADAAGTTLTNAVNVGDLKQAAAAATTKVDGDSGVSVTPQTNADGSTTYTVAAKTDGVTTEVVEGKIVAKTSPLTNDTMTGKVNTPNSPTSLATAGDIATAINNSGFTLTAQGDNGSLVKPGSTVDMKNTDGNILISKQKDSNDVTYNLSKDIKVNSVTAGNTKVSNDGVTINNGAAGQPVTLSANGLDNGGNKITNVAAGQADTDAVNVSQLNSAVAGSKENVTSSNKTVNIAETTDPTTGAKTFDLAVNTGSSLKTDPTTGKIDVNTDGNTIKQDPTTGALQVATTTITPNANGSVNAGDKTSLATAETVANAINQSGFNLTTSASEGTVSGSTNELVNPSETITLDAGKNIAVTQKGNTISVATKDEVAFKSVTVPTTNSNVVINKDGINAGNTKVTGVASGTNVAVTNVNAPTDAEKTNIANAVKNATGNMLTNAANIGDLQAVAQNVNGSVNNIVNNVNNIHNILGGIEFTTYNVDGNKTYTLNSVKSAIDHMNAEGIKYLHVNDETAGTDFKHDGKTTHDSSANGAYATAIGYDANAQGTSSIAIGHGAEATGTQSISIGTGNKVAGNHSGAFGDPNIINGTTLDGTKVVDGSYAFGNNNIINSANTFVLGNNVNNKGLDTSNNPTAMGSTVENSIYLGNQTTATADAGYNLTTSGESGSTTTGGATGTVNSATVSGVTYGGFAGATANGVVSVGASGSERRIQNVAAGEISATSTDAINGSQLYQTTSKVINSLPLQYSNVNAPVQSNGGSPTNHVTLVGANEQAPVTLHNVAEGVAPTDAVNVNQLYKLNNNLHYKMQNIADEADAGTASAMAAAGLPQAYLPGKSMVAVSGSTYRGKQGYAIGMSAISDGGNWVIKGVATGNSKGHFGATIGAGYQW